LKNPHTWRYVTVQIMLVVFGFSILVQILRIQHSAEAKAILDKDPGGGVQTFYPARGEILDLKGHLLAGNKIVYEVGVDLQVLKENEYANANTIALAASVYLDLDFATVLNWITQPPDGLRYVVLDNFASSDEEKALMDLQESVKDKPRDQTLEGLNSEPHLVRTYPEGSLAANIIGFVTQEGVGYYGVEEKYNSLLAGVPVKVWVSADPNRAEELPNIPPGVTLILTLDREVQASVEEILDAAILNTGAASGTVVVMDPKTGEILALAVTPHMNLNEYSRFKEIFPGETPFDRAISQAYEPGSVYKILTMAAALDKGVVKPEDTYWDSGINLIGGVAIRNWNNTVWGQQDMIGCLQHSINTCLVHVASLLGNDSFYSYMQKFGIGHTTGIDLAGEATGHLKLPGDSDWYPIDLGTNAFGQGVSVTPIQMVMAASAIANDGKMVYPHLVHAMVQDGWQQNISPQVAGSPISAATAHTLNDMLAISLEKESSNSLVPGYHIAGKTGTAQIPTPYGVYDSSTTNASFVGWGPVDDPKFLIYVWLEKPQTSIWGSEVAAPVFKQVVEKLVVLMGIPPDVVRLQPAGP